MDRVVRDAGKPAQTGSAQQAHQDRFRLIVRVVPCRYHIGIYRLHRFAEKAVAFDARFILGAQRPR
jgi:hypothetical protein